MRNHSKLYFRGMRIRLLFVLIAALGIGSFTQRASAQSESPTIPLKVVIKPLVPFVIAQEDQYSGFSVDLWQEIARRINRQYEYQFVNTVTEQLAAVEGGQADLAITGISITKAREEVMDFSLPYFQAGLQVMTHATDQSGLITPRTILANLVMSPEFFTVIASLLVVIVVMAHVFWLVERKRNTDFPTPYLRGIWEGIWYTVVTMVTVGYGDKTVRSVVGRIAAMVWMFASLFLVASFTANITSQLTINRFYGTVRGPEDLPGKAIATVDGSTAAQYLTAQRIPFSAVESINAAYALLEAKSVDAVVYDSPVLLYYANGEGQGRVQVVGAIFEPQDYGIAFPTNSDEREIVNQVLLEIKEDGTYDAIYARWFHTKSG